MAEAGDGLEIQHEPHGEMDSYSKRRWLSGRYTPRWVDNSRAKTVSSGLRGCKPRRIEPIRCHSGELGGIHRGNAGWFSERRGRSTRFNAALLRSDGPGKMLLCKCHVDQPPTGPRIERRGGREEAKRWPILLPAVLLQCRTTLSGLASATGVGKCSVS